MVWPRPTCTLYPYKQHRPHCYAYSTLLPCPSVTLMNGPFGSLRKRPKPKSKSSASFSWTVICCGNTWWKIQRLAAFVRFFVRLQRNSNDKEKNAFDSKFQSSKNLWFFSLSSLDTSNTSIFGQTDIPQNILSIEKKLSLFSNENLFDINRKDELNVVFGDEQLYFSINMTCYGLHLRGWASLIFWWLIHWVECVSEAIIIK